MAGKTLSTRPSISVSPISRIFRREVLFEAGALGLLLSAAFLVLAIVSYNPADVAGNVYPANTEPRNLGGRIGALIVQTGYSYIGVATYLVVALLGAYATLLFFRRKAADWPLRLIGSTLLVATFAGLFGGSYSDTGLMPSRGGIVGASVFGLLDANFGMTGAYLVLGFAGLLSLLLATDILFYPIVRDLLHPLGEDNTISGPLEIEAMPEPPAAETKDEERVGWFSRWFNNPARGETPAVEAEAAAPAAAIAVVDETPEAEAEPAPDTKKAGGRRKVVKTEKPEPEDEEEGEDASFEDELAKYKLPALEVLSAAKKIDADNHREEQSWCGEVIRQTFANFQIEVSIVGATRGPTVTTFEIKIPQDVMVNKILKYKDNLALNLRVTRLRIITSTGRATIGIEVPNRQRDTVGFRELLESPEFEKAKSKMELPMALGKDAMGAPVIRDLATMPHLLVGGATGQGKSVFENVMLASLLCARTPGEMRLILVDPKQVEFTPYADTPHLLSPVIDESRRAVGAFEWLVEEMERRYTLLKFTGCKKASEYNAMTRKARREKLEAAGQNADEAPDTLPFIVAMVDELADLMMVAADTKIDELISRITAKARAAGIHLILVTQSPRADVLTGLIKANVPARVSLRVNTGTDSRVILDATGAEDLLGKGDLLMTMPGENGMIRTQSAFIKDEDLGKLLDNLRGQMKPHYVIDPSKLRMPGGEDGPDFQAVAGGGAALDAKFSAAVDAVLANGRASAQFLRSALRIGYNAATTLVFQMEQAGILGPSRGSKEREILITFEEWEARKASGNLGGGASNQAA
ncbi:MAG: DNA translocase FtsK [Planctomycetes bacterium]|nr:DNA translocase FtsK [Planctomycetota bacterium]